MTPRALSTEDIPLVAAWIAATPLWRRYRLTEDSATRQLAAALERHDLLLTTDAGACGGGGRACALAWVMPTGAFGRSPYLRILGVAEAQRGRGIGASLLEAAERRLAQSARELFLLVSDFNLSAQRFYTRQGYVQVGAFPGYVLPDVAELLYWKRLAP